VGAPVIDDTMFRAGVPPHMGQSAETAAVVVARKMKTMSFRMMVSWMGDG
jgi:hypothetical protein